MAPDSKSASIPLHLQPQEILADAAWPTHAAVALPQDFAAPDDAFGLFEQGRQVPAQVETVATWPDGRPKWLHVFALFKFVKGRPLAYELRKLPTDSKPLASGLKVAEDDKGWTIDTGLVRFQVRRRPFTGINLLSLSGAAQPLFDSASGGPYLVDGAGHVHDAAHDPEASVVLEQSGPCQVTLRAEGWYQPAKEGIERFARYVIRIIAHAGSEVVRFEQTTTFAAPMTMRRVADLGFNIPAPCGSSRQAGLDGRVLEIADSHGAAWFHQESADRCRWWDQPKQVDSGRRFDGWFAAASGPAQVALLVKDFWQKFPGEVELGPSGVTFHVWPKHGRDTFTEAEQFDPRRINQFLCFHQGKFLDLKLPAAYFDALSEQLKKTGEQGESRPESLQAYSGEGVSLSAHFALRVTPVTAATDTAAWHALYQLDPIALPPPEWTAESKALGAIAAKGADFPEIENLIESGILAYADPSRLGDYGKFNYGDTHSKVIPPEQRAALHRNWFNNHYMLGSSLWMLVARGGLPDLLAVARRNTDHYTTVDQMRAGPTTGAFWHKGLYHWGGAPANSHGHWPDPTGLLYAWLLDANRSAKDGYGLWLKHLPPLGPGVGREVSSSLVFVAAAYDYTHNAKLLPQLQGMARSLMEVLPNKQMGHIWNPLWISVAYAISPSAASAQYVIAAVADVGIRCGGIESLAASATAYDLTHDQSYLTRHLPWLSRLSRRLYRVPNSPWNNLGFAPGPVYDEHVTLQWPDFLAALRQAHIDKLPRDVEPGCYPQGRSRNQIDTDIRGCTVLVLKSQGQPLEFTLQAAAVSQGDMQPALVTVFDPSDKVLLRAKFPDDATKTAWRTSGDQVQTRRWTVEHTEPAGLYHINIAANQLGIYQPLTKWPEAAVLKNHQLLNWREPVVHSSAASSGYLLALTSEPIKLTFAARGDTGHTRVRLIDARGQVLLSSWLLRGETETATVTLAPKPGAVWFLDVYSPPANYFDLTVEGPDRVDAPLLIGQSLAHLQEIAAAMARPLTFIQPPVR